MQQIVKPLAQGKLDGLCGVYSIVNAARYLFPKDKLDAEGLFHFILEKIDDRKRPKLLTVIKNGMCRNTLVTLYNDVLREYVFHEEKDLDMLADKKQLQSLRIDSAVQEMKEFLDKTNDDGVRRIIIAGIDGKIKHWTCITGITDNQIQFYDGEMKCQDISKFHITKEDGKEDREEYYICCKNVFFLEAYRG